MERATLMRKHNQLSNSNFKLMNHQRKTVYNHAMLLQTLGTTKEKKNL